MQGVVPAAGAGTRLRPLTANRPKGLVEVAGRPLLDHVFEALLDIDVEELVVIVGYRGDQIRHHYGNSFEGTTIRYVEQSERLGLAHAIGRARAQVSGTFVVLNGDNVARANLAEAVARHAESVAFATTIVEEVSRARAREGAVFELDQSGSVVDIVEKPETPPSRLVPRGFYVFEPVIFDALDRSEPAPTGEYELADAIRLLLTAGGEVELVDLEGWFRNVNTVTDVEAVEERLTVE